MLDRIPLENVRDKYNSTTQIWTPEDYWHFHLYLSYKRILNSVKYLLSEGLVLNLGGANQNYQISNSAMVYFDAAERSLSRENIAVCGDAHCMPFKPACFQSVIAIGSVLNYCAPAEIFAETARVLKDDGLFLFDFEQSEAFEHYGSEAFGKRSHIFRTDFNDLDETIWVFKKSYIKNLLQASGLKIVSTRSVHTITSLAWRLTENNKLTAAACKIDRISCSIPFLKKWSSNIFIIARKTSSK